MNKILQHLTTGRYSPSEGSLRAKVPSMWISLLQLCVAVSLAARGWLMYRWDSHIRGLLWNEEYISPVLAKYTSLSWEEYALESDPYITGCIEVLGVTLMIGAVLTMLMRIPYFAIFKWFLIPLWAVVALDSYSSFYDTNYQAGMLIEFALQMSLPLLLLWLLVFPNQKVAWAWGASVMVAACFVGHGLFALGYHPVPWSFLSMSSDILGFSEDGARNFLFVAGVLDCIVAIAIFLPWTRRIALYYMIFWGAITALARVVAHYDPAVKYYGLDPWLAEVLVRTSHWMIPLLLLMLLPLWNKNGRLALGLLEISSQTRRVLSKATILHR